MDITKDTNIEDIVSKIVIKIYKEGSDHRAEKRSNPSALTKCVLENEYCICIGLWEDLPPNFKALIDDSRLFSNMEEEDKKLIFSYLLKHANKYKNEKFIFKPSKDALRIIEDFVNGISDDKKKKLNVYLNPRKYFCDTERKKVGGGGGKKNSQFDFDKNDHENQRKTLRLK